MAKYRKKPIIVEAEQWYPDREIKGVHKDDSEKHYVVTIHLQRAYLNSGDWVITEPDGEHHYPCKDEIFKATFEEYIDPIKAMKKEIEKQWNLLNQKEAVVIKENK